jgi:hypothetical protein
MPGRQSGRVRQAADLRRSGYMDTPNGPLGTVRGPDHSGSGRGLPTEPPTPTRVPGGPHQEDIADRSAREKNQNQQCHDPLAEATPEQRHGGDRRNALREVTPRQGQDPCEPHGDRIGALNDPAHAGTDNRQDIRSGEEPSGA